MFARQIFIARWIQRLPDDADDIDPEFWGPNYYAARFDNYDLASFHASHVAQYGPCPDHWEVEERLMKGVHRIGLPDTWVTGRRWICGQEQNGRETLCP